MTATVLEKSQAQAKTTEPPAYRAPMALYENGDSYIVLFELPGVDEKSIALNFENGLLTVTATQAVKLPENVYARYSELKLGDYCRSLNVGDQIDDSKIEATFKSGLLTVILPKSKTVQSRKIAIKTA